MSTVSFSVLSYYPTFFTNENINIGILFYVEDTNQGYFHCVKNWGRAKAFDDELDINFMKDYLKGIQDEVDHHLFNQVSKFDIENFVRFYVNEYKFSNIQTIQTINSEQFIDITKKMYLKFDYEKSERLNKIQEHQYISNLLKSSDIKFSRKKLKGNYNEQIQYDYIIGEYAIKLFTFEGKNLAHLINSAKTWAYNAEEMQGTYKTIFIYDKEMEDIGYYDSIIKILSNHAYKVMIFNDGIEFLLSLRPNASLLSLVK
ncbi:MAG: DUF3037 domain-containing protein [Clostridiales bacterium]|nr:DUF3037 domain-containing protein [Clostridiales bacterium]